MGKGNYLINKGRNSKFSTTKKSAFKSLNKSINTSIFNPNQENDRFNSKFTTTKIRFKS